MIEKLNELYQTEINNGNNDKAETILECIMLLEAAVVSPIYTDKKNYQGAILRICPCCNDNVLITPRAMNYENYCRYCGVKFE